jgi:hypothetical protein
MMFYMYRMRRGQAKGSGARKFRVEERASEGLRIEEIQG